MRLRVIAHAVRAAVHLGDRVLVGPGLVIRDLVEDRRGICFCCRRCRRRVIRRHRRVIHRRQREGEALRRLAPVVEGFCHLKRRRRGRKCVRDVQVRLSVVLHFRRQRVCRGIFRDRDDHLMSTRVIGHAVRAAIYLGDRILIGFRGVIRDRAEACRGFVFCRYCRGVRRHRRALRHRRQIEGEAVGFSPVVELLCHLQIDGDGLNEVGNQVPVSHNIEGIACADRFPVLAGNYVAILRPVDEGIAAVGRGCHRDAVFGVKCHRTAVIQIGAGGNDFTPSVNIATAADLIPVLPCTDITDILQGTAEKKRIVPDAPHACRDRRVLEFGAVTECVFPDACHARRDH